MPETFSARLGTIIILAVCCLAIGFGSNKERTGGAIYLPACGLVLVTQQFFPAGLSYTLITLDVICLIAFIMLSWKSAHPWPVWACFCQAIIVTLHIAYANPSAPANSAASQWAYYTVRAASGYGVLTALLIGTLSAIRIKIAIKRQNSHI
ncbi:hypothetical protein [Asticcacaulis endophyticus]|uniref:Uncharacterized protein n=1 Tax=Asticcacaulis endophyticus TaxID=1395890 RepID=A0A918UXB0_9CAUL|nr:hypothetical protein [Asticcacaulis endophyticus]GGZ41094.1 hypothetical protein GCM10011273_29820 [Asticcacaulis endophyticus]